MNKGVDDPVDDFLVGVLTTPVTVGHKGLGLVWTPPNHNERRVRARTYFLISFSNIRISTA